MDMADEKIRILDLFCGMGGLSLGFAAVFRNCEIRGFDINKWAVWTYNINLNKFNCRASVQNLLRWEPDSHYNIIVGGSPCQPFSSATAKEKQGEKHHYFPTLRRYYELVEIIKPEIFIMENVKGLVSRNFCHYLTQELDRVRDEYVIKYRVLNSADFGVPQKRERLIVLGVRKELFRDFDFPKPTHQNSHISIKEALHDIIDFPLLNFRIDELNKYTETDNSILIMDIDGKIRKKRMSNFIKHHRPMDPDKPSKTLLTKPDIFLIPVVKQNGITVYRELTIREFLRIQTFPDWWEYPKNCSISERYKLIGEAVPPIFAYRLAENAARILGIKPEKPEKQIFDLPFFDKIFNSSKKEIEITIL
jgi:DNA (cytosine-5)-methyltransferase 1